jgi:hypothetical protein
MHIERALRSCHCLDNVRVRMTNTRHVVVQIDVTTAVCIEQEGAFTFYDFQRTRIEQWRTRTEEPIAALS